MTVDRGCGGRKGTPLTQAEDRSPINLRAAETHDRQRFRYGSMLVTDQ
jgi:hypothetical protein